MKVFVTRLHPHQDLKQSLIAFVNLHQIQAGLILSAVGSLEQACLRFADRTEATMLSGKFEIVSLVGTLATTGIHLHLSIADCQGNTIGGHLVSGCLIYTTAEIAIAECETLTFLRTVDAQTGYRELEVIERQPTQIENKPESHLS